MTWPEAHRLAMLKVMRLHRDLAIDLSKRVDVFGVIENLGLLLAFRPLSTASGAYVLSPTGTGGVIINSNEPLPRQRFTAAHELGHYIFRHGSSVDEEPSRRRLRTDAPLSDEEKLAEAFAEWFLMPRPLVKASVARVSHGMALTPTDVYELSIRMGASFDATARHLGNLKFGTSEEVKGWLDTPPKRIKQMLMRGATPSDWRRDVWNITAKDGNAVLCVSEGDRLVVALEEVPTSGYAWAWLNHVDAVASAGDGYSEQASDLPPSSQFSASEEAIGSPTIHWFALDVGVANSPKVTLDFAKRRPWEDRGAAERFVVDVEVEHPRLGVREDVLALTGR